MAGSVNKPAGEWLDNKQVSGGNRTKAGGEAPIALLQGRGVGRCSFPGTQPILFRRCFTMVPNLGRPKTTPGVHVQTVCVDVWGKWNRTTPVQGVNRRASGNLPEMGTRSPADLLAHTRVQCIVSEWTTGGMERLVQVSRLHGYGARSVSRIAT